MVICSVRGCRSNQRMKENNKCKYSFYRFPRDVKICREWIKRCHCSKINTLYARVCNRHFKPTDFREVKYISGQTLMTLKRQVIPTLNLPDNDTEEPKDVVSYGTSTFTITEVSEDDEAPPKPKEPQYKIKVASISAASASTSNQTTITSQPQTTLKFTPSPQYIMSTGASASTGKISLVPSNILLKSQSQQPPSNITFNPQQFLYTNTPNQAGTMQTQLANMSMPITSGTVTSNSGMPMKVLLVNRVPQNVNQNKDGVQTPTIIHAQPMTYTMANTITQAPTQVITTPATIKSITPPKPVQPQQSLLKKPTEDDRKPLPSGKMPKSNLPGFRTLLHQINQVEQQNLTMNRQRLEMEKQRFEFEKSMAEKFFAILPNLQFKINNNSHTNSNHNKQNGDGEILNNGVYCVSPKKEIMDD